MAEIVSIVYQQRKSDQTQEPFHYDRTPAERVTLRAGHGIEGDKKAGKSAQRHLNLMAQETLAQLAAQGFKTGPGELGEQLIISGLDFARLEAGMRLQLGESAVIELSLPRTGCQWFQKIQGQAPPSDLPLPLGWMASVVESGPLALGDSVQALVEIAG